MSVRLLTQFMYSVCFSDISLHAICRLLASSILVSHSQGTVVFPDIAISNINFFKLCAQCCLTQKRGDLDNVGKLQEVTPI